MARDADDVVTGGMNDAVTAKLEGIMQFAARESNKSGEEAEKWIDDQVRGAPAKKGEKLLRELTTARQRQMNVKRACTAEKWDVGISRPRNGDCRRPDVC